MNSEEVVNAGRLSETRDFDSPGKGIDYDKAWHQKITLKLILRMF